MNGKLLVRHCGKHRRGIYGYAKIIEVAGVGVAGPRRRFTDDKARIVSEAMMPGASVGDVVTVSASR